MVELTLVTVGAMQSLSMPLSFIVQLFVPVRVSLDAWSQNLLATLMVILELIPALFAWL